MSLMRTSPRPSEPNSGLTTTSRPSASNAASASVCPLPGPGWRHRQGRRLDQRQRQIFVDRRFDGPRRVENRHARGRDSVQGIHPEDDLLETSGGIIRTRTPSTAVRSSPPADTRQPPAAYRRPPRRCGNGTAFNDTPSRPAARSRSSTCQPKPETRAISDVINHISHSRSKIPESEHRDAIKWRTTAPRPRRLMPPKACITPVSMLWKTTSAGLNR